MGNKRKKNKGNMADVKRQQNTAGTSKKDISGDSSVNKVLANSSGNLVMNFNADGEWCWFLTYEKSSVLREKHICAP